MIVNIVTLVSVILSLWYSRAHPRILIFAFLLVMLTRVVLIQIMLIAYRKYTSETVRDFLQKIVQTPLPGPPPQGMYDTHTGREVGFGGSMLVLGSLALFTFFLTHVNSERKLDFQLPVFLYEIKWALWIFFIYELKDLIWKGIIIDFNLPAEKNFAYNAAEIVLLAVAVLFGSCFAAFMQSSGNNIYTWMILALLLAIKHISELVKK